MLIRTGKAELQRTGIGAEQMHIRHGDVAHRIAPTLTMMKEYVDYWAVLVANTSDNTAAVVNSIMKPVPGQVVEERTFTDFASARNRILQAGAPGTVHCIMAATIWTSPSIRSYLPAKAIIGVPAPQGSAPV